MKYYTRTKWITDDCNKSFCFSFRGDVYLSQSIVKLTQEGKSLLNSVKDTAIFMETIKGDKYWWSYEIIPCFSASNTLVKISTNAPPEYIIEEVVYPSHIDYVQRKILGDESSNRKFARKHTPKDWQVPGLMSKWIMFILAFFLVFFIKGTLLKLILWNVLCLGFGALRQIYIKEMTTYIYSSDVEMEEQKYNKFYKSKR